MSEAVPRLLAERTGRLLDEVNLQVERFDAIDGRTAFLGYVGHSDDPEAVMAVTARPIVAAFAAALDERDWPSDVDGIVLRAYDPTEPQHDRDGALEWEVSAAVARRYAAATTDETSVAATGSEATTADEAEADGAATAGTDATSGDDRASEAPESVVADAVGTARMVYDDGRVEPVSFEV